MRYLVAFLALLSSACTPPRPCTGPRPAAYMAPSCSAGTVYVFDGSACIERHLTAPDYGCACSGPGCEDRFSSRESCERAYSHCPP